MAGIEEAAVEVAATNFQAEVADPVLKAPSGFYLYVGSLACSRSVLLGGLRFTGVGTWEASLIYAMMGFYWLDGCPSSFQNTGGDVLKAGLGVEGALSFRLGF